MNGIMSLPGKSGQVEAGDVFKQCEVLGDQHVPHGSRSNTDYCQNEMFGGLEQNRT